MTYRIELTPDRMSVTADVATDAELAALQRAITVVTTLLTRPYEPAEEITREPKQAKALRAARAEKEVRPEPQETADPETDTPPEPGEIEYGRRLSAAVDQEQAAPSGDPPVIARRAAAPGSVPRDRDDKLRELWTSGLTTQQIADQLGMGSASNVSFRAKWLGLPARQRGGDRRSKPPADTFDPSYYAKHALIPDSPAGASGAEITAALMGDPAHGPSVGVERAGMQRDGGGAI